MAITIWGRQTKNSQFSRTVDQPIGKQTKGVQLVLGSVFDYFIELLFTILILMIHAKSKTHSKFKKSHLYPAQVYLY